MELNANSQGEPEASAAGTPDRPMASSHTNGYNVAMSSTPRAVRFDAAVLERLRRYVRARPGLSVSALTSRFVDEGLRMEEHPGVLFRDGPSGRRAVLIGGPDVWEVVRVVRSARAAEPDLDAEAVVRLAVETMGLRPAKVRIALNYWAAYPDEIEQQISEADEAERVAKELWQRERRLLS
jgi:hypothetical protein